MPGRRYGAGEALQSVCFCGAASDEGQIDHSIPLFEPARSFDRSNVVAGEAGQHRALADFACTRGRGPAIAGWNRGLGKNHVARSHDPAGDRIKRRGNRSLPSAAAGRALGRTPAELY
jgi:hypothetical protein